MCNLTIWAVIQINLCCFILFNPNTATKGGIQSSILHLFKQACCQPKTYKKHAAQQTAIVKQEEKLTFHETSLDRYHTLS